MHDFLKDDDQNEEVLFDAMRASTQNATADFKNTLVADVAAS